MSGRSPELVLGGTFDPVHDGHLRLAEALRETLGVSRILLLPAFVPPHKVPEAVTPARHRLAMLRRAIAGRPGLEIETLELERGEVCYTIDSLRQLRNARPDRPPVFVMGRDSLHEIPTWRDYLELIDEFDLLVIDRPGSPGPSGEPALEPAVASRLQPAVDPANAGSRLAAASLGRGGRIFPISLTTAPVSSSQVRASAAAGAELGGLVPPEVAGYIHEHGLYRREDRP